MEGQEGEHNVGVSATPTFSIAHVSPYPWEAQENEVNAHILRLAGELSEHGHSVLILAPSRSPERVRESRRELRAAKSRPESLLAETNKGAPRVLAIGEVLDVPGSGRRTRALPVDLARTLEELLSRMPLDFVHVHEPFAPSASSTALRYSRALNVGSFHAPTERLLSTTVARRFVESFFGRLDARIASRKDTADLMARYFPADYRIIADGSIEAGDNGDGGAFPHDDLAGLVTDVESIYRELAARRHEERARSGPAPSPGAAPAYRCGFAHAHRPFRRL